MTVKLSPTTTRAYEDISSGELGERLRTFRLSGSHTQAKVARAGDISGAYLSRIETGDRKPSLRVFTRMCEYMGVTPEQVLANATTLALPPSIRAHVREVLALVSTLPPNSRERVQCEADVIVFAATAAARIVGPLATQEES